MYSELDTKNFCLVREQIDTEPFREELKRYLAQRNWDTHRAKLILEQRYTKNISIRKVVVPRRRGMKVLTFEKRHELAPHVDYHELNTQTYPFFVNTYAFAERFADEISGQLTKVQIVSLDPHTQVYGHIDTGDYYRNKYRFHLPIKTKGSRTVCGSEERIFKQGELWFLNFRRYHEAFNDHAQERVHIIFDIYPKSRSLLRRSRDFFEKKVAIAQHRNK